jgi:hypothetical protein
MRKQKVLLEHPAPFKHPNRCHINPGAAAPNSHGLLSVSASYCAWEVQAVANRCLEESQPPHRSRGEKVKLAVCLINTP